MRKKIATAMVISLTLLVVGAVFSIAHAEPMIQEEPKMNIVIAAIIGTMYYLSMSPWFANLGFTVLYRPLVAGLLVGIVMGQPTKGLTIGAEINVLYLGWISAGGSLPGDPGLAGYLGTALAIGGGLSTEAALALAAPLGLLGGLTWSLRMSTCSIFAHIGDRFAKKGSIIGVALSNFVFSQPFLLLIYGLPVALAAWLGSAWVGHILEWLGRNAIWVMSGLFVASGMLAALGIALNLKFLFRRSLFPYFFIGYLVTALFSAMLGVNLNLLVMAIIGACLALLHVLFISKEEQAEAAAPVEERQRSGLLSTMDVFKSWLLWLFFSHANYNWERMQGTAFAHSMTPIIAKLYKTKEDISAALERHMVFFNTQPDIGGVVHGITIAMEEERAMGADISDEAINSVKTGLMGPMAGIGDTIQQGIVIPIALAIGMSIAQQGGIVAFSGPLVFAILIALFVWVVGWLVFYQGYKQGRTAVTSILQGGFLNRLITGAGVLGNFVMGVLAVQFVSLSTAIHFTIGGTSFALQTDFFDRFMPGLLPLLLVLFIWWLLDKAKTSPTLIMFAIIVMAVLGSAPMFSETTLPRMVVWGIAFCLVIPGFFLIPTLISEEKKGLTYALLGIRIGLYVLMVIAILFGALLAGPLDLQRGDLSLLRWALAALYFGILMPVFIALTTWSYLKKRSLGYALLGIGFDWLLVSFYAMTFVFPGGSFGLF